MTYGATLRYNEALLREAVLAFWWRSVGLAYLIALAVLFASLAFLLFLGDASWAVGAIGTTLAVGVAFPVALYFVHYRNSLRKFRSMGSPQSSFAASESSFSLSSGAGSSTLPWSAITEVWQFSTCWLLLFSKAHFVTLPLADVNSELRALILQRVRASGGKIG